MFCLTLSEKDYKSLFKKIEDGSKYTDLFEIRADYLGEIDPFELEKLLKLPYRFLFTFRSYEEGGYKKFADEYRLKWILWALEKNFYLVDIEWKFFKKFFSEFQELKFERVLISYHNFKKLPSERFLLKLLSEMEEKGVKKAKIVCMSKNLEESFRLLNLIFKAKEKGIKLISFGMGEKGRLSRILSLFCGAPFTYVVLSKKETVAPGQLDIKSAVKLYNILKKITG
jgi:3-dehydroquinate dehydratase-1